MKTFSIQVALTLLLAAAAGVSALSIENEQPVKVTHRNSGPRYDIGEFERARAMLKEAASSSTPPPPQSPPAERQEGDQEGDQAPTVGHIALRRIFLFPIMRPQAGGDEQPPGGNSGREQEDSGEQTPRVPMMMAKPLWPFMMPVRPSPGQTGQPAPDSDNEHIHDERPHLIRHLFGADEASRSPDMDRAASGERDQSRQQPLSPHAAAAFDPIQMMMDMMHQAISGQLGREFAKDLNKDQADGARPTGGDNSPAESSDERPTMPQLFATRPGSQNETREDIVEIEGRKYVRKTLINRHVGDNLVFMTRRLIFIPLNETSDEPTTGGPITTTTTTTELPPSSTSVQPAAGESDERPTPSSALPEDKPKGETPESSSVTTTTTTTSANEQPTSAAPEATEQTTPSSTSPAEPVTSATAVTEPAKSESASESKAAAGRLVEADASESNSAPKPENEKAKEKEEVAPK